MNNTVVEYDSYTNTSAVVTIPIISGNPAYLVTGIDYDRKSGSVYISAGAGAPFYTNGANLTGRDKLIRYDTTLQEIVFEADMAQVQEEVERRTGQAIGGFQDMAEDCRGNSYYMATWGNLLVKVTPLGNASLYYSPPPSQMNSTLAGFGGLFSLGDNLIVSDAISKSFVTFDTTLAKATAKHVPPANLPTNYTALLCDALYAPPRYGGSVALCSVDFYKGTGGISVYQSRDGWTTAEYMGLILNTDPSAVGTAPTATVEIAGSIYISEAYIPSPEGVLPKRTSFPFIDISREVEALLGIE